MTADLFEAVPDARPSREAMAEGAVLLRGFARPFEGELLPALRAIVKQAPFRHLGVEPRQQKILALKSTCHFRADFEPIAEKVIVVVAPGGYLADPAQYPYRRLRPGVRLRPLGPDFPGLLKGSPSPCR